MARRAEPREQKTREWYGRNTPQEGSLNTEKKPGTIIDQEARPETEENRVEYPNADSDSNDNREVEGTNQKSIQACLGAERMTEKAHRTNCQ